MTLNKASSSYKCSVIEDLSEEQFFNLLLDQGELADFSKINKRPSVKNAVFLGKALEVGKPVWNRKRTHTFHDAFFILTTSIHSSSETKEFRIIFLGGIVSSLADADIQKGFFIAVLNPSSYTAFGITSLVVGPQNPVVWIYKRAMPKYVYGLRKKSEKIENNPGVPRSAITTDNPSIYGMDSDDTDADPMYIPEKTWTVSQRSKNKIPGVTNTFEESDSVMSNSSTFSLSVRRDHEIYRSAPVNLKDLVPRNKERSSGRSSASVSPIQQIQSDYECNSEPAEEQVECFRTPQEFSNNLLSQNTAVVGSVRNTRENFNSPNFVAPVNTKTFKINHYINRTQRSGCSQIKKCNTSCQTRHSHVNFPNDGHCGYRHCNSYRPDCCRPSCHCQPCGGCYNHCCTPQTHTCSHQCRSERDCASYFESNCHCKSRAGRACLPPCRNNSMHHCSAPCREVEQSCCRRFDSCSSVCAPRQHCSSDCCNHRVASHSHHSRHNQSALKSLEQLIERRSENMNKRPGLEDSESDSDFEAAKRTQSWVQKWTPSLPAKGPSSPPPTNKPRIHSTPKDLSYRSKNKPSVASESTISDSDSEEDKSRKRMRVAKKDNTSLKTLASNSSKSTAPNSREREQSKYSNSETTQNFLDKYKNKEGRRKKKLFNPEDYSISIVEKSKIPAYIDESTPFNSEQTIVGKDLTSPQNICLSSTAKENPGTLEEMQERDLVESSLPRENSNRQSEITSAKEYSSGQQQNTNVREPMTETVIVSESDKAEAISVGPTSKVNDGVSVNNQCLVSQETSESPENAVRSQRSSEETFPELRLDSLSEGKTNSNNTPLTNSDPVNSLPNNKADEEKMTVVDDNSPRDQTREKASPNKSLSLSDYPKIKLKELVNNEGVQNFDSNIDPNRRQGSSECDDQVELVCDPKLKKRKRRKKRKGSSCASSKAESVKSVETIDLENTSSSAVPKGNVETTISSSGTFFDAQSSCSQKSKASPEEKWCLKPLHEVNLNPNASEAFMKLLPCSSKKKPYNLSLFQEFQATGIIIGTVPDVIGSTFSIVKSCCNDGCQKSYTHEEYIAMDEYEYTCQFCRYRSHWVCPGCKQKGLNNPLCMYYSFEVHLFDGENVLRIEVENQDGVKLLGCTPTVYLKESAEQKRVIQKLKKSIVTSPPSNVGPVPLLKATIKTISKNGNIILTFKDTSLKKNMIMG